MWVLVAFLYYIPNEEPLKIEIPFESYEACEAVSSKPKDFRLQFGADGIDLVCVMQGPDIPLTGNTA